jgi:signal peptide peptidase SppA
VKHTQACFVNHMGMWLIEPLFMREAVAAIIAGAWQPNVGTETARPPMDAAKTVFDPDDQSDNPRVLYRVTNEGTALVDINGPMMKGFSKFGGASSVFARRAIRTSAGDADVANILLSIDSPGGHVAGTQSLADEVRAARAAKPVHAQIEDLGASAAYWVASQAESISANRTARVGSIGTVAVAYDESKAFAAEGVKVHVVSTGAFKGAFARGAEITPDQLADLQREINGLNAHFLEAVASGRRMQADRVALLADGRVHIADDAKKLGLIDHVRGTDETLVDIARQSSAPGRRRQEMAGRGVRIARAKAGQYTPDEMATALNVPVHRVKYVLASRCVIPVAHVGQVKTYDLRGFNRVKRAIAEIQARR